jgi:hypothetical protein
MEEPVIFFLFYLAQDPSRLLWRLCFPIPPPPVKIITVEKIEDRVFELRILIKIFRKDDEEAFFFFQGSRKKGFISNQVVKLLGRLGGEEIEKLRLFRTTGVLATEALKRPNQY